MIVLLTYELCLKIVIDTCLFYTRNEKNIIKMIPFLKTETLWNGTGFCFKDNVNKNGFVKQFKLSMKYRGNIFGDYFNRKCYLKQIYIFMVEYVNSNNKT